MVDVKEMWRTGKIVDFTPEGDFYYTYDQSTDECALVLRNAASVADIPPAHAVMLGVVDGISYWLLDEGDFAYIRKNPRQSLKLDKQFCALERKIIAQACGYIHFHHSFVRDFTHPIMNGKARGDDKGTLFFPRIDPAIIVLLINCDNTKILVSMNARGAESFLYSPPAGFVEVGETLEDAVHREIAEELGLAVTDVRYHSSQSWPCPQSLMLGFTAVAKSEDFRFVDQEIVDARWLSRSDVRDIRSGENMNMIIPEPTTLAGKMISDWVEGESRIFCTQVVDNT